MKQQQTKPKTAGDGIIPMKSLCLGAGVQSTTLLLLAVKGEIEKPDNAIFADTGWEPFPVYTHLKWLCDYALEKAGIPVYWLRERDIREDALRSQVRGKKTDGGGRWASMPYYTKDKDGKIGMIRRQCTSEYKIYPIERKLRELLGYNKYERIPIGSVQQWYGISTDEMRRVRTSRTRWITNCYPLIYDYPLSRQGCRDWLIKNGYAVPMRSACVGCPFRSNGEWVELKNRSPREFDAAVKFDKQIRNCGGQRGKVYLHRLAVPLEEAVEITEDTDQGEFWNQECEGMCGV